MSTNTIKNSFSNVSNHLWLIIPVAYFLLVTLFYSFRFVLEFDPDEGNNLILANQIIGGFSLYSDVWTDHPPLLPFFLATIFRVFGLNVAIARLFILLLSCALLGAIVLYLQTFWGSLHVIVGACLVLLLPHFTRLSVSVMIGLPSIVFGVISFVNLAFWHRDRSTWFLVFSGISLGISVMIKLQTSFLPPIFIIGLILSGLSPRNGEKHWMRVLRPALIWAIVFIGFVSFVGIRFIRSQGITQLIEFHITASESTTLQSWSGDLGIFELKGTWPIFILSLIGSYYSIRKRSYMAIYLLAWIFAGLILLTQLEPLWYHHKLLITIPAGILAAIAVGEGVESIMHEGSLTVRLRNILPLAASTVALIAFLAIQLPSAVNEYNPNLPNFIPPTTPATQLQEMLAIISDYADETELIVTDRPMFAFRAGLSVPPELAVFSGKRYLSGYLTENDFLRTIQATHPEQVALTRFSMPEVVAYLDEGYRREYSSVPYLLFIRNDIPKK
jgi:predicted membrane-bound mannosyltransferase